MKQFDVVVIGGGHAGVEAAAAASRLGASVALVTMDADKIGAMSCNPAIGGLGKGHLVREIDALDGIIGRAADRAGIQYRLLNRSKGPAVQGPRAQMDRMLYRTAVQSAVAASGITVVSAAVNDLLLNANAVWGVRLDDGSEVLARSVVLTTGTFLNGVIHMGDATTQGGRIGEDAATDLAQRLYALDLPMGRLKTGTPPRLDRRTIDYGQLQEQPGDDAPEMLSFLVTSPEARQVSCHITHTNPRTHEIIAANLHRSAMYSGNITGSGPRYCPSIEDKIGRFADKTSHQIFLEPEGLQTNAVYPNGISTSLPVDVQMAYVQSIAGLGGAEIIQPGYAIEYDYVDPRALDSTLRVKSLRNLWLAGQINGTTGYEEAAAQGLIAGANAVLTLRGNQSYVPSRTSSYIGVMIDDLITRGVTEPYRMFTSRAEFRLSLRADNADQRLTPDGVTIGLVGADRRKQFAAKMDDLARGYVALRTVKASPDVANKAGIKVSERGPARTALEYMSIPGVGETKIREMFGPIEDLSDPAFRQIAKESIYSNYLDRQSADVQRLRKEEATRIPVDFQYDTVASLSHELVSKLAKVRPQHIAAAAKIEGMTPAGLNALIFALRRRSVKADRTA